MVKDLQDLLGEIHDCDVQIPERRAFAERLRGRGRRGAARGGRRGRRTSTRRCSRRRRTRAITPASPRSQSHLRARRVLLFDRFLELWDDYERKGFRARLEYAVGERADVRNACALASAAP